MIEIILIAGLPGSGKTHLGKRLSGERGYPFIDDASKTLGTDRQGALEKLRRMGIGNGLIIADPLLCMKHNIANAKSLLKEAFSESKITVICFENDPVACLKNVQARNDGRVVTGLIADLSRQWRPEEIEGCDLRRVYSSPHED